MVGTTFDTLIPELLDIIPQYIPLHTRSSSLHALSLTSKRCHDIVVPHLLYRWVVVDSEAKALILLQKLISEHNSKDSSANSEAVPLGSYVRELHILSDLSEDTKAQSNPDVFGLLESLVNSGGLPLLLSLGLHATRGWVYDTEYNSIEGFNRLQQSFWDSLFQNCPKLVELHLEGTSKPHIGHPWLGDIPMQCLNQLTALHIEFTSETFDLVTSEKLCHSLERLSTRLQALSLHIDALDISDCKIESTLLQMSFPNLQSLSLDLRVESVETETDVMVFWNNHPILQSVNVQGCRKRWFHDNLPEVGLLPQLRHLTASFHDVRALLPVVGSQLLSLTVLDTINAQIPYLLRAVVPNGLPGLKSLDMHQRATRSAGDVKFHGESSLWYETEAGPFVSTTRQERYFNNDYLLLISLGAPNLEELRLSGWLEGDLHDSLQEHLETMGPSFGRFKSLKRLYLQWDYARRSQIDFFASVKELIRQHPSLDSVTEISRYHGYRPYPSVKVRRTVEGEVYMVRDTVGLGMIVGRDDVAFPC